MQRYAVNAPSISYEVVEDEVVVINYDNGDYFGLQDAAADIWILLAAGKPVDAVITAIGARYSEPPSTAEAMSYFIGELERENLIVPDQSVEERPAQLPDRPQRMPFTAPILEKYTDMRDLLLLDPIHEVNQGAGWPNRLPDTPQQTG